MTTGSIKPACPLDVLRWPDGVWCYRGEADWAFYKNRGDGYEVLTPDHPEYELLTGELA